MYFAGVMVRLMLTLTPVVCILSAIAFSSTLDNYLNDAEEIKPTEKSKKKKIGPAAGNNDQELKLKRRKKDKDREKENDRDQSDMVRTQLKQLFCLIEQHLSLSHFAFHLHYLSCCRSNLFNSQEWMSAI